MSKRSRVRDIQSPDYGLPVRKEPEPNYFGRLLEVMSAAEITVYINRLNLRGQTRVAEVLMDELAERSLPDL